MMELEFGSPWKQKGPSSIDDGARPPPRRGRRYGVYRTSDLKRFSPHMNFLSETPWWAPTGCWTVGIVLFITGNNRLHAKMKYTGAAVVALGALFAILSYFLQSPREKAISQTRALVAAVEKRDWVEMQSLLHPELTLIGWKGRAEMVKGAKYYSERYDLKSLSITSIDAIEIDDDVRVSVAVLADFKEAAGILTRWTLEWTETREGWVLAAVEPRGGPMVDAASIENRFKGPPRGD